MLTKELLNEVIEKASNRINYSYYKIIKNEFFIFVRFFMKKDKKVYFEVAIDKHSNEVTLSINNNVIIVYPSVKMYLA